MESEHYEEELLCTSMGETDGRAALDCRDFSIESLPYLSLPLATHEAGGSNYARFGGRIAKVENWGVL